MDNEKDTNIRKTPEELFAEIIESQLLKDMFDLENQPLCDVDD